MELVVKLGDREEQVEIEESGGGYRVRIGERCLQVDHAAVRGDLASLLVDGRQYEAAVRPGGNGDWEVIDRHGSHPVHVADRLTWLGEQAAGEAAGRGAQKVTAYMPGRVAAVLVEEGQEVAAGQGLVVLEAMKMENEIQAEAAGTVQRLHVTVGDAVEGGALLVELGA